MVFVTEKSFVSQFAASATKSQDPIVDSLAYLVPYGVPSQPLSVCHRNSLSFDSIDKVGIIRTFNKTVVMTK